MTADYIIKKLNLKPLPGEGGFFRETFKSKTIRIGNNLVGEERPQVIVPAHTWQGTKLINGGQFALFGTTMSPGFEFTDYIQGHKQELIKTYPTIANEIENYFHP